ncbi:hypothetical protein XENTR_v10015163 [Xenopus tropicalis]|nr:hypothetical protein XENTR_v10015163 [Xenopus tropicalis]
MPREGLRSSKFFGEGGEPESNTSVEPQCRGAVGSMSPLTKTVLGGGCYTYLYIFILFNCFFFLHSYSYSIPIKANDPILCVFVVVFFIFIFVFECSINKQVFYGTQWIYIYICVCLSCVICFSVSISGCSLHENVSPP